MARYEILVVDRPKTIGTVLSDEKHKGRTSGGVTLGFAMGIMAWQQKVELRVHVLGPSETHFG
jgi:hypothetical protein